MELFNDYGVSVNELRELEDKIFALTRDFLVSIPEDVALLELRAVGSCVSGAVNCAVSDVILKRAMDKRKKK